MSPDQDAVLAANQTFYRAFEKRSLDAMTQVWSQGIASICIHPGRDTLRGWPAIRESWDKIFQAADYIEIEPEIIVVEATDSIGYVILTETVTQVIGRRRFDSITLATNIFENMGTHWYMVHHHGSLIMT